MNRIDLNHSTSPAAGNDNQPTTLGTLAAMLDRHAAELRGVAPTPLLRGLVARIAVQAIQRTMRDPE